RRARARAPASPAAPTARSERHRSRSRRPRNRARPPPCPRRARDASCRQIRRRVSSRTSIAQRRFLVRGDTRRQELGALASPLWGGVGGGGPALGRRSTPSHHPPPHPSPTRGEGADRASRAP